MDQIHKLEIAHKNLVEQLDLIDIDNMPGIIESLKLITKGLGNALYLPDFNNISGLPVESFSCDACGSTNIETTLTFKEPRPSSKGAKHGSVYMKYCNACKHTYHVDEAGKLCIVY